MVDPSRSGLERTITDSVNRPRPPKVAVNVTLIAAALCLAGCVAPGPGPGPSTTTTIPVSGWAPPPGTTFQIQFSGLPVDTSVAAAAYDIDGFDTDASLVATLHGQGRKAICYISAGSSEDWRPDFGQFPAEVLGNPLDGWPGERWLDVRRLDVLGPLMASRMDMCRTKGFDAVDPDNVDGYANTTGFPLSAADQLAYNRMLADLAHDRGLSIGLKNDLDQIPELVADFDFAVNEQCAQYSECNYLTPFIGAGKAVFEIEYSLAPSQFCPQSTALGLSGIRKNLSLDAFRQAC